MAKWYLALETDYISEPHPQPRDGIDLGLGETEYVFHLNLKRARLHKMTVNVGGVNGS